MFTQLQNVIPLLAVATAVVYVVVRAYLTFRASRSQSGCGGGCHSCTASGEVKPVPQLVHIQPPRNQP